MNIRDKIEGYVPEEFKILKDHFPRDAQVFGRRAEKNTYHFWNVASLWSATQNNSAQLVSIEKFQPTLKNWFPSGADILLKCLVEHIHRMQNSDLDTPILSTPLHEIVDGNHRYLKAAYEEKSEILVLYLEVFPPPELVYTVQADEATR